MRTPDPRILGMSAVLAVCAVGPSHASDILHSGGWVSAPLISRELVRRDMVVETLVVEVDCGGVAGVDNLPDGWTTSVQSRGETTVVTVSKPQLLDSPMSVEDAKNQASDFDRFRFRILGRGEWSDCMTARFSVDMRPRQRVVGIPGALVGGASLHFSAGDFDRWRRMDGQGDRP